jgi:hypothetical protein
MLRIIKQIASVVAIALVLFLLLVVVTRGQETEANILATGGNYTLQKAVVAGGGREKQTQAVGENGTAGQAIAGHHSQGGQFSVRSGFWTPDDLTPSAAGVTVSGRVTTADGRGITSVRVSIVSPTGETRTVMTTTFGYFRFTDVEAGQTYILSVASKRFSFAESSRLIQVADNIADCNFVASPLQ